MSIKDRIKKIETYFKEMQIVTIDGKQVIYVIVTFPNGWIIEEDINEKYNITVSSGQYSGEYYFCGEIDNGEEAVFDAIDYNISKMKAAIERAKLLNEKIIELKSIFSDENISLESLRNMKIIYNKHTPIYDDPTTITANTELMLIKQDNTVNNPDETEVKIENSAISFDKTDKKNKKLTVNSNE